MVAAIILASGRNIGNGSSTMWGTSAAGTWAESISVPDHQLMFPKVKGWKKSNEKNAWLVYKFIFLSFWTINYDAVFDILFFNLSAFTHFALKDVCNSNDINPNRNVWIKKVPLFKMAYSPVKNVRAEKRDNTNCSKMRQSYIKKIDLHFDHWNPGPNRPILRYILV